MKKFVLLVMGIWLLCGVAAGCGGEKKADGPKTLKVGTEVTFPPFEYREKGSQEIVGFDIDLIRAIGQKLGMEVELLDMDFEALIPSVRRGNVNLVIAGMTITPERRKVVDMSEPYFTSGLCVVVNKGNTDIQQPEDLKGRLVAAQIGTTGEEKAKALAGDKVKSFKTNEEVFQALQAKQVEAVMMDMPVARHYLHKLKLDAVIVGQAFDTADYGIVTRRHGELTPKINKALAELKQSGEYDKLYAKWFGKEANK